MPDPTATTTEEGCSSNEEDQTTSTAVGTLTSQELIERIRDRVRRQVVEEFLTACEGDERKKALILELSAQVLGERIAPPTVVERFSSLNEEDSSSSSSEDDSSDQDNLKWAHVVSMESITLSPYEPGASAEVGEELFEAFEDLMVPEREKKKSLQRRCIGTLVEPSQQAIQVLGRETAQILIAARYHISQSGMLFSADWLNQHIRGVEVKGMNKLMILVSLPEQRISRAEKCVLTVLVQQLQLAEIIREVLDDLVGMSASTLFPQLADCMETPYPYRRLQQTACQKCEIFVARAYTCMNYLKRDTIENETMVRKIFDCLSIMERNLDFKPSTPPLRPPIFIDVPQAVVAGPDGDDGTEDGCDTTENAIYERSSSSAKASMAIEQLELDSGRVIKRWDSILEVNTFFGKGMWASEIRENIAGTRKEAYGYCWRKAQSNALPSSKDECRLIEKLDLASGKVLGCYRTVEEANISVGKPRSTTRISCFLRHCAKHDNTRHGSAYGFYWRYAGQKNLPDGLDCARPQHLQNCSKTSNHLGPTSSGIIVSDPVQKQSTLSTQRRSSGIFLSQPVEQLSLEKGKVLRRFNSIREANLFLGEDPGSWGILDVLEGKLTSASGFLWRKADAIDSSKMAKLSNGALAQVTNKDAASTQEMRNDNVAVNIDKGKRHIEKLDLQTGLVIDSYTSHEEANISLGRRATCSYLKSTLDGRYKSTGGFFWRFAGSTTPSGTWIANIPAAAPHRTAPQAATSRTGTGIGNSSAVASLESHATHRKAPQTAAPRTGTGIANSSAEASLESHVPHQKAPQTAAPRTGTGIANSSAVASLESHPPHRKAPQTATSKNKETSNSIQPLVQKLVIRRATCSSIDQESEVPRACATSVPNNLSDDAPRASGSIFSDAGNTNRPDSDELAISRKRLGIDGNVGDEIPFRKKVKPDRPVEIVDGDSQFSDAPTGIPLSSFSGRPSTRIISAMPDIDESPYQESATAEIGEEIFDKFKSLLQPKSAPGCRHPQASLDAIDVFGSAALANAVIEASSKIALSGMTYSDQWTEENTYGLSIKGVPKPLLLLLLQEQRFSRPNASGALKKIVDEFDLCKKMIVALVRWKLAGKYTKLVTAKNHTAFGTQLPQCYKCLIFIARALICVETLKIEELPESIQRKVESCFCILEGNFGSRPQPRRLAMGVDHAVNVDEDEKSNVSGFDCSSPLQKITESSHVLFQVQQVAASSTTIPSVVNAPLPPKVTSPAVHSFRKSSGTILQETPNAKSHAFTSWVPHDSEEVILKPLECEVAWLVEEARYCLRDRATVHWRFLWKYASPALRVELLRVQDHDNPSLEQLVRLHDKIVSERFSTLRRDVRRKILKGNSRPRMKQAIDSERLASWQAQEKKNLASPPS